MKYFRIPIDKYYLAIENTKRPKFCNAFSTYTAAYCDTVAYVAGEVKDEYYNLLSEKDEVTEFSQEEYEIAIKRINGGE